MRDTKKCAACDGLLHRGKGDNDYRWTRRTVHKECRARANANKLLRFGTDTLHLNEYLYGKGWQEKMDGLARRGLGRVIEGGW